MVLAGVAAADANNTEAAPAAGMLPPPPPRLLAAAEIISLMAASNAKLLLLGMMLVVLTLFLSIVLSLALASRKCAGAGETGGGQTKWRPNRPWAMVFDDGKHHGLDRQTKTFKTSSPTQGDSTW